MFRERVVFPHVTIYQLRITDRDGNSTPKETKNIPYTGIQT